MRECLDKDFQEGEEILEGWELVLRNPIPRGETSQMSGILEVNTAVLPDTVIFVLISDEEYASQTLRLFLLQEPCDTVARYPYPDGIRNHGERFRRRRMENDNPGAAGGVSDQVDSLIAAIAVPITTSRIASQ